MGTRLKTGAAVGLLAVVVWFCSQPDPISELDVHGTWEEGFAEVAEVFRRNLKNGMLRGGNFAAYLDGRVVVNLWGGYADEEYRLEWAETTINTMVSLSKVATAITFATLVDRGYVQYDDLVSKHWPEFAQNGKDNITVNMLISHQAGLHRLDEVVSFKEVISNPDRVEAILAKQTPAWEPGTAVGYHAVTFGMYVDFLARKVDPKHRPIYQIYEEEIRKPLGLDFYIGTPLSEQYRLARVHPTTLRDALRDFLNNPPFRKLIMAELMGNKWSKDTFASVPEDEVKTFFADPEMRATPMPSCGAIGDAVSGAKLFGLVAARVPIKGKPLVSDRVVKQLNTPSLNGEELQFKFNVTVGHGTFILQNPWGDNVFGHPTVGGQVGYCDPTNKVGVVFSTNHWGAFAANEDLRFVQLERAFYRCLKKKTK